MRLKPCYLCHGAKFLCGVACPACSSPRCVEIGGMTFSVERDVIGEGFVFANQVPDDLLIDVVVGNGTVNLKGE